jgi:hypothetical protein
MNTPQKDLAHTFCETTLASVRSRVLKKMQLLLCSQSSKGACRGARAVLKKPQFVASQNGSSSSVFNLKTDSQKKKTFCRACQVS